MAACLPFLSLPILFSPVLDATAAIESKNFPNQRLICRFIPLLGRVGNREKRCKTIFRRFRRRRTLLRLTARSFEKMCSGLVVTPTRYRIAILRSVVKMFFELVIGDPRECKNSVYSFNFVLRVFFLLKSSFNNHFSFFFLVIFINNFLHIFEIKVANLQK